MDIHTTPQFLAATEVNQWVIDNRIEILNVAGSKASGDPKIYEDTAHILEGAILLGMAATDPKDQIRDSAKAEYLKKVPVPPREVDEALGLLIERMSLKDKAIVANMGEDELASLDKNLGVYIKDTFRIAHNTELMTACRSLSRASAMDEDEASGVIIKALHQDLYKSHRLRRVK
jgi:hypothetical protein